jgi:hypothetical protein
VLVAVFAAGMASAQTIDFSLTATENGNSVLIPNASIVPFIATVGTQQSATVIATYTGSSQATITQPLQQLGSAEFTVTSNLTLPETFTNGQSFTIQITFKPANANGASGEIGVTYTEPTGVGGAPVQNLIQIGLEGESPSFVLSYILATNQNVIQIPPGGNIPFGTTQINTTADAYLNITNAGSGPGVITGITTPAAGSPFKVQGVPLLPATLAPAGTAGNNLQLLVTYTPTAVETDTAQVLITYQGGVTATVTLMGSGITSTFTYKVLITGMPQTTVTPGGTITFPGANVGSSSNLILTVTNTGSASGTINSISASGPFTLTTPITTVPTLTPGSSFSVPLTFTPTQVGTQTGYLVVGNAPAFNLSGKGLGSNLTFAYTSSAGTTPVTPPNGAVVFSPIEVGQSEQVTFVITNSGSLPATISNIGPNPANGPYTISPIALPLTLQPSQSAHFAIIFTPTTTGFDDGNLVLDTTSIPLIGSGTTPPALPSYTIAGPSGNVASATQSNISLTLSKGYPLALTGTLTLTTEGIFGTDPSVQFAIGNSAGNRTVGFTIPANSTSANFQGQGSELPVQTGTVAETVTLTPTFATAGGVDVTPASPTTLQFTIPSAAPVLESAAIANEATNGFDLVLTGYSTTRSLSSLNVTFNPASGFNIGTSQLTIDLTQVSTAWFSTTASQSYGGQFAITMPFTLQGTVKAGQALINSIASVTSTVSNSTGTSGSLQANVQ